MHIPFALCLALGLCLCLSRGERAVAAAGGELRISVIDTDTGEPIPCRMHLKNAKGAPVKSGGKAFWHDHFVFDGNLKLKLPQGNYMFELEHGPEYVDRKGYFTINPGADDEQVIDLKRSVNMADDGWFAGDLHIHRPEKDIRLLMEAEELHIAPLITWSNDKSLYKGKALPQEPIVKFDGNRYYNLLGGEDERGGGSLLFFNLAEPLDMSGATREYPPSMKFLLAARTQQKAWIDVEKPFAWDLPIWLATGHVDSIELANSNMHRDNMTMNEGTGKPRDRGRLPDPKGNGQWSEEIYYHVLNAGFRIPPSAGSGSGQAPNPVGYNRVYAWVDKNDFNYETWWESFRQGRVVVTNGPLIRPLANNRLPGQIFTGAAGEELQLEVTLNLTTRERIEYLDLVKNGRVVQSVRLDEVAQTGHLPPVPFTESGWLLVRGVTDIDKTYRFVSTAPWYVDIGDRPRISRTSAQFFLDWLEERASKLKLDDPAERQAAMGYIDEARAFWQQRVADANAD